MVRYFVSVLRPILNCKSFYGGLKENIPENKRKYISIAHMFLSVRPLFISR